MLKFAFTDGLLDLSERLRFLSSFEQAANSHLETLISIRRSAARQMPLHGRLSLDHQVAVAEANRSWIAHAKAELAKS